MFCVCLCDDVLFGVCLFKSGFEVVQDGVVLVFEIIGCMVCIIECDIGEFGMLYLQVIGMQCFELLLYCVEGNGLLVGIVELLFDDILFEGEQVFVQFGLCVEVFECIIDVLKKFDLEKMLFGELFCFDDLSWVLNCFVELLLFDLCVWQKLMEFLDVGVCIDVVYYVFDWYGWL